MLERSKHRQRHRLPPTAVVGSLLVHAILGIVFIGASLSMKPPLLPAQTYRVRLVAAADETAPVRLRPQPAAVAEEEHRPPPPQPTSDPAPETEVPTVVEDTPPPVEPSTEPARADETGEEAINVQLDGATFAYPEYLNNIIRQVHRYWRPPTGNRNLRAEIVFVIERDGSVSDMEWLRRSGDLSFDLEARGAVEAVGQKRAFGPLPDGYVRDQLRVSFFFDPASL